jgi:hypothetical protein
MTFTRPYRIGAAVAAVVLLVAVGLYLPRRGASPWRIWDMRAGMPFSTLNAQSVLNQHHAYTCTPLYAGANRCTVDVQNGRVTLTALVDSTGRVISLTFDRGPYGYGSRDDAARVVFLGEIARLKLAWDRIRPGRPDPDMLPAEGHGTRWLTRDGRWLAKLEYVGTDAAPMRIVVQDEPAARRWEESDPALLTSLYVAGLAWRLPRASRTTALVPAVDSAPARILVGLQADLQSMILAQEVFFAENNRYANVATELRLRFSDGAEIAIAPLDGGWSAVATHPLAPGRGCAVWSGYGVQPPTTPGGRLVQEQRKPLCDPS